MEPLTALSVASSVIQFVDFGSKLLANGRQLYRSAEGVLTENVDLELVASDLHNLTMGLKRKLPKNRALGRPGKARQLNDDDEALDRLCERCVEIAETLMKLLEKLKVPNKEGKDGSKGGEAQDGAGDDTGLMDEDEKDNDILPVANKTIPATSNPAYTTTRKSAKSILNYSSAKEGPKAMHFRKWDSFRKALEASWNRKEIEALAATLRDFKSEIEFRIIVSFRGALKDLAVQQSQTSSQLTLSTQKILDAYMTSRDGLAQQLQVQAEKLIQIQEELKGKEEFVSQKWQNFFKGELGPIGGFQTPKALRNRELQQAGDVARATEIEEEMHMLMIENSIFCSLAFASLADRSESVEIAYHQTFEWIFKDLNVFMKSRSNFTEWLRRGDGIYWISGKAGSGKSTLMRYICEHKRTKEELDIWAASASMPVEISSFYFWHSGDEEQKSQCGLLRSLLFEILQRHREILPQVMPGVWDAWSTRASSLFSSKLPPSSPLLPPEPKPWTLSQLKDIFRASLRIIQVKTKTCLFIDGLDEYDGEYEDIVELFQDYAKSPNVKICVSSRPLLVFERSFDDLPGLKVQNLTRGDISHFVKDKLGSHRYMVQLSQQHAAEVSQVMDEIVEKASGVFLWVKLVVQSILRGLRDYNRISDLYKRVLELPADLEALYAHMLKHTDPFYHEQASQIFQIVRTAKRRPGDVTLLSLSWADEEDELLAENAQVRPITQDEIALRCRVMDTRLKSLCSGLLESMDVQFSDIAPDSKVLFLHRTVSDWFAKAEVWEMLLSRTAGTRFSPNLAMLKSSVLQLKCAHVSGTCPLDMNIISNALSYAKDAEADLNYGFPKLLDQLDMVASYHWRMSNANGMYPDAKTQKTIEDDFEDDAEDDLLLTFSFAERSTIAQPSYMSFTSRLQMANALTSFKSPYGYAMPCLLKEIPLSMRACSFNPHGSINIPSAGNLHHWTYGLALPGLKPIGLPSTFYDVCRNIGLVHYTSIKYDSGIIIDHDVSQHLLTHAVARLAVCCWSGRTGAEIVQLREALEGGADPNLSYFGDTPWEVACVAMVSDLAAGKSRRGAVDCWGEVFEAFLKHGADPRLLCRRHAMLPGHPRLSPLMIVERFFEEAAPETARKLKSFLEERMRCSSARRESRCDIRP